MQCLSRKSGRCVLESRAEARREVVGIKDGGPRLEGGGYPVFEEHDVQGVFGGGAWDGSRCSVARTDFLAGAS